MRHLDPLFLNITLQPKLAYVNLQNTLPTVFVIVLFQGRDTMTMATITRKTFTCFWFIGSVFYCIIFPRWMYCTKADIVLEKEEGSISRSTGRE